MVIIFGADHIYRMNIRDMLEFHKQRGSQATVAAIPVDREQAAEFGVIETVTDGLIVGFHEKNPTRPPCRRSRSRLCFHGQLCFLDRPAAARAVRRRRKPRQLT